eukprot:NODE_13803_length_1146_cov_3.019627.p1 GENE.NODE_13803_length_1146_cov_3.019627~~NODE_13803_length_1146_cov_3.019627.p1  ORF type:complete len:243 (-),score=32.63 NODE_13803_length_1146_cov_3.019627:150-878(-)
MRVHRRDLAVRALPRPVVRSTSATHAPNYHAVLIRQYALAQHAAQRAQHMTRACTGAHSCMVNGAHRSVCTRSQEPRVTRRHMAPVPAVLRRAVAIRSYTASGQAIFEGSITPRRAHAVAPPRITLARRRQGAHGPPRRGAPATHCPSGSHVICGRAVTREPATARPGANVAASPRGMCSSCDSAPPGRSTATAGTPQRTSCATRANACGRGAFVACGYAGRGGKRGGVAPSARTSTDAVAA